MRIRYAYKLQNADGTVSFATISKKLSETEVQEMFADKGIVTATFHERVRTGYRLTETGELAETGLAKAKGAPAAVPASPKAPKAKKSKKAKKA